jgi:hypothetical protein
MSARKHPRGGIRRCEASAPPPWRVRPARRAATNSGTRKSPLFGMCVGGMTGHESRDPDDLAIALQADLRDAQSPKQNQQAAHSNFEVDPALQARDRGLIETRSPFEPYLGQSLLQSKPSNLLSKLEANRIAAAVQHTRRLRNAVGRCLGARIRHDATQQGEGRLPNTRQLSLDNSVLNPDFLGRRYSDDAHMKDPLSEIWGRP